MSSLNGEYTQGPLTYPSITYNFQETELFKSDILQSIKTTDGQAIFTGGTITNLNDPVDPSDVCTKNYLENKKVIPGEPLLSVQYNNNGDFSGSSLMTFNGNLLSVDEITNGTATFSEGTISGLSLPTASQQAANKEYTDNLSQLTQSTIVLSSSFTYSPEQMVNGIIYRDPISSSLTNTSFDNTASASSIISQFKNTSVGNSAIFYLKNITSSESAYIYLKPGLGVSFNSGSGGITVPKNYIMKSRIVITGASTVLIFIESVLYAGNDVSTKFLSVDKNLSVISEDPLITPNISRVFLVDSLKVEEALFNTYYDDANFVYNNDVPLSWSSIFYGQATRNNLTKNTNIYFPNPSSTFIFLTGFSGLYKFVFRNADDTYNITLYGSGGWIMDENANFVIPSKTAALMWFYVDGTTGKITVYMIGKKVFKN